MAGPRNGKQLNESAFGTFSTGSIIAIAITIALIILALISAEAYQIHSRTQRELSRIKVCQTAGVNPDEVANCIKIVTSNK